MPTFGLIAEGVTDQKVIENLLCGYFSHLDECVDVNPVVPLRDETDRHRVENYSNWEIVMDYVGSDKFKQAFQFNDFLVVQIDTDVSDEVGFDVEKAPGGKDLPVDELVRRVKQRLVEEIGEVFFTLVCPRVLFAKNQKKAEQTKGCLKRLNRAMAGGKVKAVGDGKDPRKYDKASRGYLKRKNINRHAPRNPSLQLFIEELERLGSA